MKKQTILGFAAGLLAFLTIAWTVTDFSLNTNQFATLSGNKVIIKPGALTTNFNARGLTVPAGGITNAGVLVNSGKIFANGDLEVLGTFTADQQANFNAGATVNNGLTVDTIGTTTFTGPVTNQHPVYVQQAGVSPSRIDIYETNKTYSSAFEGPKNLTNNITWLMPTNPPGAGSTNLAITATTSGGTGVTNQVGYVSGGSTGITLQTNGVNVGSGITTVNWGGNTVTGNVSGATANLGVVPMSYSLTLSQTAVFSPADGQTVYVGGDPGGATTSFAIARVEVPRAGTIKRVWLKARVTGTLGTTETVSHYIRINDTTDVGQIDLTYDVATSEGGNTSVSHAVVAGDYIALKVVSPTWATNPTNIRWFCLVYIE